MLLMHDMDFCTRKMGSNHRLGFVHISYSPMTRSFTKRRRPRRRPSELEMLTTPTQIIRLDEPCFATQAIEAALSASLR